MNWEVIAYAVAGSLAVVVLRPWRLFWARNRCPQCNGLLPRWDAWGWKEDWACSGCGCLINR
jgi:hypothetical protein